LSPMFREAESYHRLGWATIWLYPRSKRPIESGWTTGPRHSWETLKSQYQTGMNLGVRLGTPSPVGEGYLACLDVDIADVRWGKAAADTALAALRAAGWTQKKGMPPQVVSGNGRGSAHYYFRTARPFRQITYGKAKGQWEVVAYSDGRQMVLPPSIHPDTGAEYRWKNGRIPQVVELPMLRMGAGIETVNREYLPDLSNFEAVAGADLLVTELSEPMQRLLRTADTGDRSSALVPVTRALLSAGASREEILTILTDPEYALSQCAYDHAKSRDRRRAADWLNRYTVDRMVRESRAEGIFQPVSGSSAADKVEIAKEVVADLHRDRQGNLKTDLHNIRVLLEKVSPQLFRLNEFSRRMFYGANAPWGEFKNAPVTDIDAHLIQHWLSAQFEINAGPQLVWAAITVVAKANAFHPVKEYLLALSWDGKPRLDTWLKRYLGADMEEPYLSEVSRKTLVAAVARILQPGVKFDHMLVLEGAQGIGKSTAIADLAGGYFLGSLPNIRDKDAMIALQGAWFVEISELATLRRVDSESYKAFFSASIDSFRAPYGRSNEECPRQCIFIGTTNHTDYLSDNTGNRRFWPVQTHHYKWKSLVAVRDQLFAEAVTIWLTFGEELHLSSEVRQQSARVQFERLAENEEMVLTSQFNEFFNRQLELPETERFDFTRFKLLDLFGPSGPYSHYPSQRNHLTQLVARVLRSRGFQRFESRGVNWWRPIISTPHILHPPYIEKPRPARTSLSGEE
jgi:predicted P-loop ATPase